MSVYVLLRTIVPRLLRAKVDRHNWGTTTSYSLWPPRLPGYSLLCINYDHQSLIEASNCVVLVINTCGENRVRLRRGGITVVSCPSTEQLLDAEQLLAERLLAERLLDAEHLSHRRVTRTVVTNLESILLRLAESSLHVHISDRVLYTEVQKKGSVAYHRDPAAIRCDLPIHPLFGHPTQSWQAIGQSQTEHLRKTVQMLSPKTS